MHMVAPSLKNQLESFWEYFYGENSLACGDIDTQVGTHMSTHEQALLEQFDILVPASDISSLACLKLCRYRFISTLMSDI